MPSGGLRHLKILRMEMWGCLPPEIGSLSSLKDLEIWNNLGESLPDEIGCLSNLKVSRIGHHWWIAESCDTECSRLQGISNYPWRVWGFGEPGRGDF
jgi:hypothetical protein